MSFRGVFNLRATGLPLSIFMLNQANPNLATALYIMHGHDIKIHLLISLLKAYFPKG